MDSLFWQSVSGSDNPDAYRAYLRQFPQGTFADLASLRILELEAASGSPAASGFAGAATASRSTRDTPYVIAVVAPSGFDPGFCWQDVDSRAMAKAASSRIQAADGFAFLHRYYHAEDTCSLWRKSGMRLKRVDHEIFAYYRSSGVASMTDALVDELARERGAAH